MSTLTKYPKGSFKELWSISFPLMMSAFAVLLMVFVDRMFLALYSVPAFNACAKASNACWVLIGGLGMVTAMSEVFVAQYNGAKLYTKIGSAVWQMIWLALCSFLVFIPLALWAAPWIFSSGPYVHLERTYFFYFMFFGSAYPLLTALTGFFVGQGKTKLIIKIAITGNLINIFLDWLLIFGIKGIIPEMGIKGAAIATSIGSFIQSAILAYIFMKKSNQKIFGTNEMAFKPKLFKECFKIGFPQGLFYALEMLGWAIFLFIMDKMGEKFITISAFCQTIILLLTFFLDGLSRGVTAIAGNLIGEKKQNLIKKLLMSSLKLQVLFSLLTAIFLIFKPEIILKLTSYFQATPKTSLIIFDSTLKTCLFCVFFFLFLEGTRWIFSGILTAAGDTWFLLLSGSLSVWIFLLFPTYLVIVKYKQTVEIAWIITVFYSLALCIAYFLRFKTGKWKKLDLAKNEMKFSENEMKENNADFANKKQAVKEDNQD